MIRTLILSASAAVLAAGVANAGTVKVSLAGKTEATIKAEMVKAAETACNDAPAIEYAPCVHETYRDAMAKVAKIRAIRTASLTF